MQVSTLFAESSKKIVRRFEELLMTKRKRKGVILLSLVLIATIIPVFFVSCKNSQSSKSKDSNHRENVIPSSQPLTEVQPFIHRTEDPLEDPIYNAIQIFYKDSLEFENSSLITAPIILKEIEQADEVKVIIYVKMTEYKVFSDSLEPGFSMSLPSALIFEKAGENKYELKEYIMPEDGENYPSSVRAFCQPDGGLAEQILARKVISNKELNELLENNLREYIETNKLDIQ